MMLSPFVYNFSELVKFLARAFNIAGSPYYSKFFSLDLAVKTVSVEDKAQVTHYIGRSKPKVLQFLIVVVALVATLYASLVGNRVTQ